jgi:multidrug efflux pump subunit AcrA (membrane-fusion protein)
MTARYNAPADEELSAVPRGWFGRQADRLTGFFSHGPLRTASHLLPERFGGRTGLILNGAIVAALLLVAAATVWTVRGGNEKPVSTAQTVRVDTGEVTATVSANGNVASGSTLNVDFQSNSGIVRSILVKEGDKVAKGQILATVDSTSASQGLEKALAQLDSAEAAYETATQGETDEEEEKDKRSVDQAKESVESAKETLALTEKQQNAAVASAEQRLADAKNTYSANPTAENKQAVTSAESALTSAKNSRDSAVLQAQQQVDSAQASLDSTKANVKVNQEDPKEGSVKSAEAEIRNAKAGVAEARTTLDETNLRAPIDGTVAQINGTVGEAYSARQENSSSSSSGDSGSSTSTSGGGGFITLTGADSLQVTADVAEADIADVRIGQSATVTLSASGKEVTGKVTAIDTVETVTNNVVEYGVTVALDSTSGIKLGQSTQVVITTDSKSDVLRVSSSALTTIGQRTTATVRQKDGTTRTAVVVTGLEGDDYTEILSGLSAGDTLEVPKQGSSSGGFTFPSGGLGGIR